MGSGNKIFCAEESVSGKAEQVSKEGLHTINKVPEAYTVSVVENTETDENYKLVVNVHDDVWHFFKSLFADLLLDENEYTEIQAPCDKVPACAVPETCGKPN